MNILVTGGAGYIGSHTLIELVKAGHTPIVIDNLSNSSEESLKRVEKITGTKITFYNADVRDAVVLDKIFETHVIDSIIHFAGLKAVGVSVREPLFYYQNNLGSTLTLLDRMNAHTIKKIVFSSSATVYGDPAFLPLTEDAPLSATNPYGQTKLMIEQILKDLVVSSADWNITALRYFNPIGAHESGTIGEDPDGIPNNLLPYVAQVATGKLNKVHVLGDDYDTPDGTGIRDYIHVVDLAKAHVAALNHLDHPNEYKVYNIGTGGADSVLDMIKAFEKASGKEIPYEVGPRRAGDIAACYADVSLAEKELGWKAEFTIEEGCRDSWKWQSQNPNGY